MTDTPTPAAADEPTMTVTLTDGTTRDIRLKALTERHFLMLSKHYAQSQRAADGGAQVMAIGAMLAIIDTLIVDDDDRLWLDGRLVDETLDPEAFIASLIDAQTPEGLRGKVAASRPRIRRR